MASNAESNQKPNSCGKGLLLTGDIIMKIDGRGDHRSRATGELGLVTLRVTNHTKRYQASSKQLRSEIASSVRGSYPHSLLGAALRP